MRILLGVGAADDSLTALERTAARAADVGDEVTVAIVESELGDRSVADVEAEVTRVLEEYGLEADIRHLDGDNAGSRLVDIAESEGFDRIALGGGTTSPMGKIQLGSIVEFVLLNSHVSVTLVR